MSEVVIKVENLSKRYQLGERESYQALRDIIASSISSPLRKLFGSNGKPQKDVESSHLWALKDVSFEIKRGEVVGIIGRNGAGKSTLLKILSRITRPTSGYAEINGRVGSLLEVGTGFHPELTGRENIFLNGAILGMRKAEIKYKFDAIVAFAEIEKFIDTPVKRYSSGMYVRLAFAVTAHLESEILLVDEVLAVGDAQFQKKCLGKIGDVATEGRTVLFVSHNVSALMRLCPRALRLNAGNLLADDNSRIVISDYLSEGAKTNGMISLASDIQKPMCLRTVQILNECRSPSGRFDIGETLRIGIEYEINRPVTGAHVICFINTFDGINLLGSGDADCSPDRLERREAGFYRSEFCIPPFLLGEGTYSLTVSIGVPYLHVYDRYESILSFEVFDGSSTRGIYQHKRRPGLLGLEIPWKVIKLN